MMKKTLNENRSASSSTESNSFLLSTGNIHKTIQLKKDNSGMLELAAALTAQKGGSSGVSDQEIDKASALLTAFANEKDESEIQAVMNKIETALEASHREAPVRQESAPIQGVRKAVKYALIGAAIGTIIPIIGNVLGAVIGYDLGRRADLQQYAVWSEAAIPAGFAANHILFASRDAAELYGSIYFPGGRIRLVHGHGPTVSTHALIARYSLTGDKHHTFSEWRAKHHPTFARAQRKLAKMNAPMAAVGVNGSVFELLGTDLNAGFKTHLSRGGAAAFPVISQQSMKLLYHAANTGSNSVLRDAMNSDPDLRRIPTH